MAKWQGRSLTKLSGGRIWARRGKRKREIGSEFVETRLGPKKTVKQRAYGNKQKIKLLSVDIANVMDSETGQSRLVKIITVTENRADRHFVRRNVITKGALIETELGKARVMSRPGQNGVINAVLIKESKV